jgi:hypothetical protein
MLSCRGCGGRAVLLYLGLDTSTQHLTLQVLEVETGAPRLVFEHTTNVDRDLPRYGIRDVILPSEGPRVAVAQPLMRADALDRAMTVFARSGWKYPRRVWRWPCRSARNWPKSHRDTGLKTLLAPPATAP